MNMFTFFRSQLLRLGLLSAICLSAVGANAQTAPAWASVQRNGGVGPGNSNSNGGRIAVAADGSKYVTGSFSGTTTLGSVTLTPGAGTAHSYLAKYNAAGAVVWAKQMNSSGSQGVDFRNAAVAVDPAGSVYLSGSFNVTVTFNSTTLTTATRDAYLVKYDAQGVQQWVRQGGSPDVEAGGLATDASGNVCLSGYFQSTVSFGGPAIAGGGVFYCKLSPSGAVLNGFRVGSRDLVTPFQLQSLALDGAGNAYLTGTFTGTSTFGSTALVSVGDADIFLVKLSAAGTVLWAVRDGGPLADIATSIAVDANGNPLVGGSYDDDNVTSKIYVARFTTQGVPVWSRQIASTVPDIHYVNSAAYDGRGGYFVTGDFDGTVVFGSISLSTPSRNMFVVRYNSQGTAVWADRTVATSGNFSTGVGIGFDAAGNGYLSGTFSGTAALGTFTTTGLADAFVAKFTPGGVLTATRPSIASLVLEVYPNPATGSATLVLPAGGGRVVFMDALGRVVREQALPATAGACPIVLAGLVPGHYQVRATLGNGVVASAPLQVR